MEHSPLEIFRTEKKGFGLRATADVQRFVPILLLPDDGYPQRHVHFFSDYLL
jgi:hypothetical protein